MTDFDSGVHNVLSDLHYSNRTVSNIFVNLLPFNEIDCAKNIQMIQIILYIYTILSANVPHKIRNTAPYLKSTPRK